MTNSGQLESIGGPAGGTDSDPEWSPDHKWLAFINSNAGANATLWWVAAGARPAVQVATATVDSFAWSPTGETLAFTTSPPAAPAPPPIERDTLWVAGAGQPPKALTGPTVTGGPAGSPGGAELAFGGWKPSLASPNIPADGTWMLQVIPASGGSPATWATASHAEVIPVSWWPSGGGIVYWAQSVEGNGFLDSGAPTYSVAKGSQPKLLASMLEVPSWLSWSPSGTLALVAGGGRQVWAGGKQVETCDVTAGSCAPAADGNGSVALSPGWLSPGSLTYLTASASGPFGPGGGASSSGGWMAQWNETHTLEVSSTVVPGTGTGTGPGVVAYSWAATGNSLLYVRDDALWLLPLFPTAAPAVRVARPLFPTAAPSGYYGVVDWSGTYSWTGAPPPTTPVLFSTISDELGG